MKRFMVAVTTGVLVLSAHAEVAKPVTIKSGKMFEKCLLLTPPQKIEYSFESTAKVNFNLHYHKGEQVYYPVKLDRTNGESGLYVAKAKETYCLMWENKSGADVELNFSTKVAK
jgi:hypothetical protein